MSGKSFRSDPEQSKRTFQRCHGPGIPPSRTGKPGNCHSDATSRSRSKSVVVTEFGPDLHDPGVPKGWSGGASTPERGLAKLSARESPSTSSVIAAIPERSRAQRSGSMEVGSSPRTPPAASPVLSWAAARMASSREIPLDRSSGPSWLRGGLAPTRDEPCPFPDGALRIAVSWIVE